MIEIKVHDQKEFEKSLKTFEKKCNKDGFLKELRERKYFRKPSEVRREKVRQAKRKQQIENRKNKQ